MKLPVDILIILGIAFGLLGVISKIAGESILGSAIKSPISYLILGIYCLALALILDFKAKNK